MKSKEIALCGLLCALAVTMLWFLSPEKAGRERLFSALLILLCLLSCLLLHLHLSHICC